jgi:hypothetical protein
MEADFSGYATKAGLKCSDGRTIMKDAFAHQDKMTVPLVWQHGHSEPTNVLGHAVLENREDGVYTYGYFNSTPHGQAAKALVEHKDIQFLSIYANQLVEKAKQVFHGAIREVSLVLAGANPGAKIDFVAVQHSDGELTEMEDEAIIHTGIELTLEEPAVEKLEHTEELNEDTMQTLYDSLNDKQKDVVHYMIGAALEGADGETVSHAADDNGETVQDVYDTLTDKQKEVVHYMIGVALENAVKHSDEDDNAATADAAADENKDDEETDGTAPDDSAPDDDRTDGSAPEDSPTNTNEGDLAHQEGNDMTRNVFEQNGTGAANGPHLSHDDMVGILSDAQELGSFKKAAEKYALAHSITNLDLMFPDAKTVVDSPQMVQRRTEWVAKVLDGVKKSPFANVKTLLADITADEARAKGYVKGAQKVEEVLVLLARSTGPTTIYKKQALDRDDLLDITEYDVVNWLWAEMRLMIEEEVARAILVGDGRSALSADKVKDPAGATDGKGIRSVLHDSDLYSIKTELAANVSPKDAVKGLVRARSKYRGSGKPTLFISDAFLTDIMLDEDKFGRALYATEQELADKLRVESIVTIDLFDEYDNLFAIMVSLSDYTVGTNRGGELTRFEDFDIDFNKHKYLQETRLSGGLTKPFSAIVVTRGEGTLAAATAPSFDGATDTITIPTVTGVNYLIDDEVVDGDVVITGPTEVVAEPDEGYYLATNSTRSWTYTV